MRHLDTLNALYARCTDPTLTHEAVERAVFAVTDALAPADAVALARAFGVTRRLAGRADAARRILARVSERKGRHERGEVIAAVAAGV